VDDKFTRENYRKNVGHMGYLSYVTLQGPWFYINGEQDLKFKTRGDNEHDLREALIKYDIDWWESELQKIVKEMSDLLYQQTITKKRFDVFLKRKSGDDTQ
jgi:hypothetical protein